MFPEEDIQKGFQRTERWPSCPTASKSADGGGWSMQRTIFASQQKGGLFYLVKDMCAASVTKVLRSEAVDSTCLHQLPACFLCPNPRATSHLKWAIFYGSVK